MNNALAKLHSWRCGVGILACGVCGARGAALGQAHGLPALGAAPGGGIGGAVLLRLNRHLRA